MIIIFGENGQVARELRKAVASRDLESQSFSSTEADFRDPDQIVEILNEAPPGSVVINAAAYTQVDLAESEASAAMQINALTPGVIARLCHKRGFKLVHISTDYVFSGDLPRGYREHDQTGPIGVYGSSKLLGERQILDSGAQAIILRSSWVFSAHGKNFVKTMLRLGDERDQLSVVSDQTGNPTSAESIARTCLELAIKAANLPASSDLWGIYHFCGAPATNWHAFAKEIFRQSNQFVNVVPIRTDQYPTPAKRPLNSVLACGKIKKNFGITQPNWAQDLSVVLNQLGYLYNADRKRSENTAPIEGARV